MDDDYEGREISEEDAADSLGFYDVEAMRWYDSITFDGRGEGMTSVDHVVLKEIANLRSRVARQENRSTGNEIVGRGC